MKELPLAFRRAGDFSLLRASCPSPLRGQLRCSRRSCGAVPVQEKSPKESTLFCAFEELLCRLNWRERFRSNRSTPEDAPPSSNTDFTKLNVGQAAEPCTPPRRTRKCHLRSLSTCMSRSSWGATQRAFFLGDSSGGVEALLLGETKTLDYMRLLSHALRAIRCANVRFGILPPQSRLRGNDEHVPPAYARMTSSG
jgi:hypothetical protein